MKWFGRSKKKAVEDYEKNHIDKLKKESETTSKEKVSKSNTQKIEKENELKSPDVHNETKNTDSIPKKLQLVKEEYNEVIGNLMQIKREQKDAMEKIQKANSDYEGIVSKIKLLKTDLLKVNNELREKSENLSKITEEYKKHSLVIQEINNSKKEVVELKTEIKNYNNELESVRSKTDNFPGVKKMREEKNRLENEIFQKNKDVDSSIKELKFIQNEIANAGKNKEPTNIVDAASAVVASMKQKLQNAQKELDLVRKALEQERKAKKE